MSEILITGVVGAISQHPESSSGEGAPIIKGKNRTRAGKKARPETAPPSEEEMETEHHTLDSTG